MNFDANLKGAPKAYLINLKDVMYSDQLHLNGTRMSLREQLQAIFYKYGHMASVLSIVLAIIVFEIARLRHNHINPRNIAMAVFICNAVITYLSFLDVYIMNNPGVGTLIRWGFASVFLAPQLIFSVVLLYSNVIGYSTPSSYKEFYFILVTYLGLIMWSWFIITGIDAAG